MDELGQNGEANEEQENEESPQTPGKRKNLSTHDC